MRYREITESITPDELRDRIHDFNPFALRKMSEGIVIFKGMSLPIDVEVLPPRERRSQYSKDNYYTSFMSNDPAWSGYPKRSFSHISTTSRKKAGMYGGVYAIIPSPSSEIAICPESDVWDSFPVIRTMGHRDMSQFQMWLTDVITEAQSMGLDVSREEANSSYDGLMMTLEKIQSWHNRHHIQWLGKHDVDNLVKEIRHILDPVANGFSLVEYRDYDIPMSSSLGQEVWFTEDALVINWDTYQEALTGISP